MESKVVVHIDFSGYLLSVYFDELNYYQEAKNFGEDFTEVMFNRALERILKDGINLPNGDKWYTVEPC